MSGLIFFESGGVRVDCLGAYTETTTARSSHTFSSVDLGPASPTGLLVIAGMVNGANANTATANGNSATQINNISPLSLFQIAGESGTGDVVLQSSNSSGTTWSIILYKLRGLQSFTPTANTAVSTNSGSLSVLAQGACVAAAASFGSGASPISWTNLVGDVEITSGSGAGLIVMSGASQTLRTASSPLNISFSSGGSPYRLVAASWR